MPFASAYVMVLCHCILKHRIRFKTVLLWKGVWRCLNGVELKQHEFYAFFSMYNRQPLGTQGGKQVVGMNCQKRLLCGLKQGDYQHPFDKKAVEALEKIPLLKPACEYLTQNTIERYHSIRYIGSYLRITPINHPYFYKYLQYACQILDIRTIPELYIKRSAIIDGFTTGIERPMIVLSTAIFDCCTDDEILFLIGHECGHIKSGHLLYGMLSQAIGIISRSLKISRFATKPLQYALTYWKQMSDFSADRAGFLCCQSRKSVMNVFVKMAGMPNSFYNMTKPVDFLEQVRECQGIDFMSNNMMQIMIEDESVPWTVVRAAQLLEWTDGNQPRELLHRYQKQIKLLT